MKSSVYISAEQIEVIGYVGGAVKQFVTYPLAEGTMINGTITDAAFLTECLTAMRKENPKLFTDPTLIVDGSSILSRRLVTPKLSHKRTLQLVRDDFADTTGDRDNLICGYHKLNAEGGADAIVACAANKSLVDSYAAAFKSAGIKISAIRIGAEALLKFVGSNPDLKKASFVLNLIDGFTQVSMIFENGNNVFMSRSRLYGETKEQKFQNVLENLHGLINFNRSEKFSEITRCYYLGVTEADMRLIEALNPYGDISMGMLNLFRNTKGVLPPEAHFVYLNMLMPSDSIDLMAGRKELDKHIRHSKPKKLWIPFMILYILLLAAPTGYYIWQVYLVGKDIDEANAYLQDAGVLEKQEMLDALTRDTSRYRGMIGQQEEMAAWEETMIRASSGLLDLFISAYAGVDVTQFAFDEKTGHVKISAKCADENTASFYVDFLEDSDMVKTIIYRGFSYDSNGLYSFSIDITLNEPKEAE